jgi:hypothetical protein
MLRKGQEPPEHHPLRAVRGFFYSLVIQSFKLEVCEGIAQKA